VGGEIAGITYWVDAEGLAPQAPEDAPLPDSGWYFVAVKRPWEPDRVAEGLELGPGMTEEKLAETVEQALEVVANQVLEARYLTDAYKRLIAIRKSHNVMGAVWFNLLDVRPPRGKSDAWYFHTGLFDRSNRTKRSWTSLQQVTGAR
jgi:hypothetical protein